jgi:hypothetical protein
LNLSKNSAAIPEFSPSGQGVRIFAKGSLPNGETGRKKGNIEAYSNGRYLTITGRRLKNAPMIVEARQEAIDDLYAQSFKKAEARAEAARNGNTPAIRQMRNCSRKLLLLAMVTSSSDSLAAILTAIHHNLKPTVHSAGCSHTGREILCR